MFISVSPVLEMNVMDVSSTVCRKTKWLYYEDKNDQVLCESVRRCMSKKRSMTIVISDFDEEHTRQV